MVSLLSPGWSNERRLSDTVSDIGSGRWVSVSEAAGVLSVSERTVRRRVASGELPSRRDGRRLLVNVSGVVSSEVDTMTEVVRLQAEVDKLTAIVNQLTGERDYLRGLVAEVMLLRQPVIEAPKERAWWQFWKSD